MIPTSGTPAEESSTVVQCVKPRGIEMSLACFHTFLPYNAHTHTLTHVLLPVLSSVREDRCTLPTTPSGTSSLLVGQRLSRLYIDIDGLTYARSLPLSLPLSPSLSRTRITERAIVQRDTLHFLSHTVHHICFSPPSVSHPLPVL